MASGDVVQEGRSSGAKQRSTTDSTAERRWDGWKGAEGVWPPERQRAQAPQQCSHTLALALSRKTSNIMAGLREHSQGGSAVAASSAHPAQRG